MNILRRKASGVARLLTRRNAVVLDVPDAWAIRQGRFLTVYPDDTFLVAYPRSGSTWLRFLLGNLLDPAAPSSFTNIEARVPDVYHQPDSLLARMPRPRLLKSHEYLTPRYPAVLYLVRDPRDVAVSNYHFLRKIGAVPDVCSLAEFVPGLLRAEFNAFGSWGDHVGGWLGARQNSPRFMLLRYEDLLADPYSALRQVAGFLTLNTGDDDIRRAVERSRFESMQALEKEQSELWSSTRGTRSDIPFVRSARPGAWHDSLDAASAQAVVDAWGDMMRRLGYLQA